MTTREEFEKWYATKWKLDKECTSFDIWQACDELNKARIAELEKALEMPKFNSVK